MNAIKMALWHWAHLLRTSWLGWRRRVKWRLGGVRLETHRAKAKGSQ